MKKFLITGALLALPLTFTSCSKKDERPLTALEAKGKSVFMANCIACHNVNPALVGSVGPAIAGSSLELLTERIMRKSYPAGYKPQRETHLMPELPFLEADIPAIHAYINSFKK